MADNLIANPQNLLAGAPNVPLGPTGPIGPWTWEAGSVSAGASDPQGGTGAFQFTEDTTLDVHGWFQMLARPALTVTYRITVYDKPNNRNFRMGLFSGDGASTAYVTFDGITGAIIDGPANIGSNFSFGPATAVQAGNGFLFCTFDVTVDASQAVMGVTNKAINGITNSYTGDGISGIFAWQPSVIVMPSLMPRGLARM